MRRLLLSLLLGLTIIGNSGCFLNLWSADPNERMEQMLFTSENYRQIRDEWRRFWFTDQPSHLTYDRIHGGISP
ncbi:MAG: hypothetical protein ACFCD0_06515 [Gemmataceae bacterium]